MTLAQRIIEAGARALFQRMFAKVRPAPKWEDMPQKIRDHWTSVASDTLTAALALAEAEGAPEAARETLGAYRAGQITSEECWADICRTLAGKVAL